MENALASGGASNSLAGAFTSAAHRRKVAVDTPHDCSLLIDFGIRASEAACQPAGARFRRSGGNMISDFDREHISEIMEGHGDWFTAQLLRLCRKADSENLERLRLGFPHVVQAYLDWYNGDGS